MKFMDCALSTAKTLFLVKNKFFISSIMNSLAAALFIIVADRMANAPDDLKIYIAGIIFLANFLGSYLPPKVIDFLEEDRLFIYNITFNNLDDGKTAADSLRELNIPVATSIVYNSDTEKTLKCSAYASTKVQSRIINDLLQQYDHKLNIIQAI